jgi:outer membrane lipoprotein-sorting protein
MEQRRMRRLRWALPAGAVIAVAALIAGTEAAAAQPSPSLPSRTAAQLLAGVAAAGRPVPLTGTYTETVSLGLPDLPGGGGPLSGANLLSGTHTFMIWSGGPQELRIAEPVQLGEADVRQFGNQVWLWNSRTQQATNIVLPATVSQPGSASASPAPSGAGPRRVPLTPQQLARRILAAVGPTTVVSVLDNVTVAGQPAYQLALAPKDSRSLIGHVTIAIDARRYLPLRVQVFARGASGPAVQSGYTSLSFGAPAASNFTFTPPPGAKVKTINVPARPPHPRFRGRPGGAGHRDGGPNVLGTGWLAVLAVPPSAAATTAQTAVPVYGDGGHLVAYTSGTAIVPTATPFSAAGLAADPAALRALLNAATPVRGAWGSGRLLRTSLLSVLFTTQGAVLAGAVTPAVLYADAAAVK